MMLKALITLLLAVAPVALPHVANAETAGFAPLLVARRGGEAGISLDQAVQQVRQETGGRVLSADSVRQGDRLVHRIKVLTPSGHVRVYTIDAQAGRR